MRNPLTVRDFNLAFTAAGYISPAALGLDDGHVKRIVQELNVALAQPTSNEQGLRRALEALADKMGERCGDHCPSSCRICEARNDLRLILVRTARPVPECAP